MAPRSRTWLKGLWVTGYKPTQQNFADFFDSFFNLLDDAVQAYGKYGSVEVETTGTEVIFNLPFTTGVNYELLTRCYDADGEVGFTITNKTELGFTVNPAVNATFVYQCIVI